jgi:TonB family protein
VRARRIRALGCGLVLATLAPAAQADDPGSAAAGRPVGNVAAAPPVHEDAIPGGPSVRARLDEIRRRVQRAAHYPEVARARNVEGDTWVTFEIDARGNASGIETRRTSGSHALDRAGMEAVAAAAPLPWVHGRVTVPIRFSLADPP